MTKPAIYLIGGTTEANRAARRLQDEGYKVVVSVATQLGEQVAAAAGVVTDPGKKDADAMAAAAGRHGAAAIVDCSHPFAREVSKQAIQAAAQAGLPYLRYTRPPVAAVVVAGAATAAGATAAAGTPLVETESFERAAAETANFEGRAFITVGTRHLEPFVRAGLDFTARILPLTESFEQCTRLGIEPKDIIAAWPPFSVDFNRACLRKCGAATLVTKDSGREGGLMEKLEAAVAEGVAVILIKRPPEPGAIHDLEALVAGLQAGLNNGLAGHGVTLP